MPNYGIFVNFVFCIFKLKKEIIPQKISKKVVIAAFSAATKFQADWENYVAASSYMSQQSPS